MRIDTRFLGFGLFFIAFGIALLGERQGWISPELIDRAWQLWPVLLIGVGVSILFSGRALAEVGGLVISAALGLMAASFVSGGGGFPLGTCGGDDASATPFARQSGELTGEVRVEIDFNCGELMVGTGGGATWALEGRSEDGVVPTVEQEAGSLRLESAGGRGIFGISEGRSSWTLTLPTDPTLGVDFGLNAGSGTIDLGGVRLGDVEAQANAGSIRVDLRDAVAIGSLKVSVNAGSSVVWLPELALQGEISANAGSATICAPEGVGLRLVVGSNPISSNDYASQGLVQVGDAWETADFGSADVRINLVTEANAGSLSLNPQRTCTG
ncbi:MAG TPA: DUF5668 domain-containing protein [Candidatus Limnocylindrales bacterium]|nr:DUF5668 domain-containing protein [Candidatus Limnocylindrales bacterium]